jgi:type IV secretion system protein VirB9
MKTMIVGFLIASALSPAFAVDLPVPGQNDPRVRYVTYKKDDVTVVKVRRGTATRIVLGNDEQIIKDGAASGFVADCSKPELEWCIRADVGSNQIWVKPKDNATYNNLELKTDKRDYSFEFKVLSDVKGAKGVPGKALANEPMFRVIFKYPVPMTSLASLLMNTGMNQVSPAVSERATVDARLADAAAKPRNWKYTIKVMKGGEDIAPSLIFDDGRFTYFRFPANRKIPTIEQISSSGEPGRVSYHMDENDPDLVVVEQLGKQFVLRINSAVVGVWNEAFDPDGVAPKSGTTVDGVARIIR